MPSGLKRLQQTGNLHFITFSCHERRPYLGTPDNRNLFLRTLEKTCLKYQAVLDGFVIMPEHVHLLLYEPAEIALSTMMQALKCSVSKQSKQRPFWYPRYYDFNIFTEHKRTKN